MGELPYITELFVLYLREIQIIIQLQSLHQPFLQDIISISENNYNLFTVSSSSLDIRTHAQYSYWEFLVA